MTEHAKHKFSLFVLSIIIMFAIGVGFFFVWLLRPYPTVTVSGVSKVNNTPSDGSFKTGDVVRWTTGEVCQPPGKTTAEIYAILDFKTEFGVVTSKTRVVSREFTTPTGFPECIKNNPTSVYIDGDLPSGIYRFEIEAGVYNPTPQPECRTFQGPNNVKVIRVVGNE